MALCLPLCRRSQHARTHTRARARAHTHTGSWAALGACPGLQQPLHAQDPAVGATPPRSGSGGGGGGGGRWRARSGCVGAAVCGGLGGWRERSGGADAEELDLGQGLGVDCGHLALLHLGQQVHPLRYGLRTAERVNRRGLSTGLAADKKTTNNRPFRIAVCPRWCDRAKCPSSRRVAYDMS